MIRGGSRFAFDPASGGSTQYQRLSIRCLLNDIEYDSHRVTLQHRIPFERAGLPLPAPDQLLDPVLVKLSKAEASRLIDALKEMA